LCEADLFPPLLNVPSSLPPQLLLQVGDEVTLYQRTFHLIGCDDFTRGFYRQLGAELPPNGEYPQDPFRALQDFKKGATQRVNVRAKATGDARQFLDNDRKVRSGMWGVVSVCLTRLFVARSVRRENFKTHVLASFSCTFFSYL
jgi:hypothetical protein